MSMAQDFFVIFVNDSPQYTVAGNERVAQEKLSELRESYYRDYQWMFSSEQEYRNECYWHIKRMGGEIAESDSQIEEKAVREKARFSAAALIRNPEMTHAERIAHWENIHQVLNKK